MGFECGQIATVNVNCVKTGVSWDKVAESDIELYKCLVYEQICGLDLDCDIIFCSDENCTEETHRNSINEMCKNITSILLNCGQEAFPKRKNKKKQKPYWLELVEPSRRRALFWHAIWCQNDKPNEGYIAEIRRKTRSEYHKTVRSLYRNEKALRNQRMVNRIIANKSRTLWNEVKKLNPRKCSVPVCMDLASIYRNYNGIIVSTPSIQFSVSRK